MEEKEGKKPNPLAAQVLDASRAGQVYQEGAVVSREIVRGEKGTVTVFSFDQGQGLSGTPPPSTPWSTSSTARPRSSSRGSLTNLVAGEMIIMPAGRPHALNARKPFKMILTLIRS